MGEFRLGIIGGCLSHQPGIPISKLYHQQAAATLKVTDNVDLKVRIGRGFDLDYPERLSELLSRAQVDGILLHSRVVFIRKTGLLVYYETKGTRYYVVHPCLFQRQMHGNWMKLEREQFHHSPVILRQSAPQNYTYAEPLPGTRVGGFRLRQLNQMLGNWLGLDQWAIEDELFELRAFQQACQARNLPCLVMGPTPSGTASGLTRKMNRALQMRLPALGMPFCNLELPRGHALDAIQFGDGTHLTEDGHKFVAERLSPVLAQWIRTSLNTAQG